MDVHSLAEFEPLAQAALTPETWAYFSGGSWDEVSLRENEAAFRRRILRPRVLIDVSKIDTATTLLGARIAAPFGFAPTALQGLAHPEGEVVPARVAGRKSLPYILSTFASRSVETVAAVGRGLRWFQLYVQTDRRLTERLVHRAAEASYQAIVLTVDLPRPGHRERELRFPLTDEGPFGNVDRGAVGDAYMDFITGTIDPSLDWDDVAWLRTLTPLPLVIKGVLTAEDATLAVEAGAAGVVVSNHGGRQLDRAPASIDALEGVVAAVDGRAEVYLDGGVRRGTDIDTALALGARAVFLGRPFLYALASGGEAGVRRAVELLHVELETAMALLGCPSVASITRDRVG